MSVAFIDTFENWEVTQALGELPSALYLYGSPSVSSNHGTACAEIIYDMAPGASITLASGVSYVDFAQTIVGLAELGHDVIASSQAPIEPGPGDGTGVLADAIDQARNNYGSVYVQSAGNQAKQHWDGYFTDPDLDGVHEWDGQTAELNRFEVTSPKTLSILLSWDDWPMSDQDFDLFLYYWDGFEWLVVDASINPQTGHQQPWEHVSYTAYIPGTYGILVGKIDATETPFLDLMMHTSDIEIEFKVADRSLDDIAASPSAISAAAVDYQTGTIEDFSSRGPTYGPGGSPTGGYQQPRIAGYDKVTTLNLPVFLGTSAACPHVAGAAALVRGAFPSYTPTQVQAFLEGRANDGGAFGYDFEYGHGRLWLGDPPVACSYTISPTSRNHGSSEGTGTVSVTTGAGCTWTATSNSTWIVVTSGSSGSGSGTVSYSVAENTSANPRTGTLTIAGKTFTVTQAGTAQVADFTISNYNPDIGETVTFTAAPGIQPVSWNFGGQNCDGQSPHVDCGSVPGDCRVMQWEWAEAGTKAVTMATATLGSKTRYPNVNNAGSCPGSCDATTPPNASFTMSPNPALVNETVAFADTSTGTGPNAPTSWLWKVRRSGQVIFTRSVRNFTHDFDEDGIYQVELTASNCGYSDVETRDLFVWPDSTGGQAWVVPSAVRTAGLNNTEWKTDLYIFNSGDQATSIEMVFLPADSDNSHGSFSAVSLNLEPKDTRIFRDVMSIFPGVPPDGVKGSIWIEPDSGENTELVIGSRTYNDTPQGTFGQYVPGIPVVSPSDDFLYLTGLTENESFRTNIGLVNLEPRLANNIAFTLYDEGGNQMGYTFGTGVLPSSSTQIIRIARYAGITENLDTFSLRIALNGNKVVAYASVVDNVTGDPVYLAPGIENANKCSVPGLAHLPGLNSSTWRSDITFFNPKQHQLEAGFQYFPDDYSGWVPTTSISLLPMQAILMTDVVGSISHPGGENSKGHIVVSGNWNSTAPLTSARTYNLDPTAGTFGQNVHVFDGSRLIEEGQSGYMPGVCNSADGVTGSRTNIGIVNSSTGGMSAQVLITFWTETGTIVASSKTVQLDSDGMYQANLFDLLELGDYDLCGTARVKVQFGGPVAAYASIIDNRTQDPIMVPALVSE